MTRLRLYFVFFLVATGFSLVLFRAFQLQVLPQDRVRRLAKRQLTQRLEIVGRRGVITDRNGRELAVSTNSGSVYANPKLVKDARATADALAKALKLPKDALLKRLQMSAERKFIWVKRQLSREQMTAFKKLDLKSLPGVGLLPEYRREYPQGELASHVLGFVSIDGKGLGGLERAFNGNLAGATSTLQLNRDALGRPIFSHRDQVRWEYEKGADLELTLDARLQFVAESTLSEAVELHKAEGGTVIVMDPYNGELLALANAPSFDPNRPHLGPRTSLRNRALSEPVEPGSTLKPFVVARALEEKKVTPQTVINTYGGKLKIGKHVISEAEKKHEFDRMTVADIIRYSSNVGTVVVKNLIGFKRLEDTYERLGFASTTGIELAGESRGLFPRPKANQYLEQATISFGQGIALTPIQLTRAYAAIANGGYLVRPTLVKRLDSKPVIENQSREVKRVFSAETTRTMAELLEKVVEQEGTGKLARIDGFKVAGKTGTAQRVDYSKGGYESGSYWSSFVGFVPSKNPRFVVYVMLDRPTRNGYYGGVVAAPVFSRVAREALRMHSPQYQLTHAPQVAPQQLKRAAAPVLPSASLALARGSFVKGTSLELNALGASPMLIPDLQGLPLRAALRLLEDYPLEIQTSGAGYRVQDQEPKAGTALPKDSRIRIRLVN